MLNRVPTLASAALLSIGAALPMTTPTALAGGELILPNQTLERPSLRTSDDARAEQGRRCFQLKQELSSPNVHPRARDRILVQAGCRAQSWFHRDQN